LPGIHPTSANRLQRKSKEQISLKASTCIIHFRLLSNSASSTCFTCYQRISRLFIGKHTVARTSLIRSVVTSSSSLPHTPLASIPSDTLPISQRHRALYISLRAPSGNPRQDLARNAR
jgi:hypothetical protein